MELKYKVYLFTFPNGKKYCGYTSQSLHHRWDNGNGYKQCPLVYKAILKYGWDNIQKELVYSFATAEEGLQKEKELIAQLKLTDPQYGYNLHEGGKPTGNKKFITEETRQKMSERQKALWSDPVYRQKMMLIRKTQRHPSTMIQKAIKASAESRRGKIPHNALPVLQIDKDTNTIIQEYPSASHAVFALTGSKDGCSNILKVCKNQRKTAYGYKWRFKNE